jgi:hypothetical protein
MKRWPVICAIAALFGGCTPPERPLPLTPPGEPAAPVARRPLPEGTPPLTIPPLVAPSEPQAPSVSVPAGLLYVCVTDVAGERRQVGIEFTPKVHALCARHPEMGPCQYERNVCRQSGGRVFAVGGEEITARTEAEYDRKVMRLRLRSN